MRRRRKVRTPRRRVVVMEKVCTASGMPRRCMLYSTRQGSLEVQLGQSGGQTLQLMRSHPLFDDFRPSVSLPLPPELRSFSFK